LLLVTRPAQQAQGWVSKLRAQGLRAAALPLLDIGPPPSAAPLQHMRAALAPGALVMFVSPNAVEQCFAAWGRCGDWPKGVLAAATGPGTVAALEAAGVPRACIVAPPANAPQFDSEALWRQLRQDDWHGREVWVVRGEGGRDWFADTLRAAGATVRLVQGYSRGAPVLCEAGRRLLVQALATPDQTHWLISSSEALDHLASLAPGADWSGASAWVTHPRMAERARALGWGRVREIATGLDAVVAALRQPGA
jgi:uroporphyrinogen-III synthase